MKHIPLLIFLAIISCSGYEQKQPVEAKQPEEQKVPEMAYKLLEKKMLTGDFNGDGIQDTIFQHNINAETGLSIDSCPDPWKYEWDSVAMYFSRNHSQITLSSSLPGVGKRILDGGLGLYCFINIGDNNHDKKDEVALVVEKTDNTRVNYCEIYSICGKTWVQLKLFSVYEGAFDSLDNKPPATDRILGFLEKKEGTWKYLDYIDDLQNEDETTVGKFQPLRLKPCKK